MTSRRVLWFLVGVLAVLVFALHAGPSQAQATQTYGASGTCTTSVSTYTGAWPGISATCENAIQVAYAHYDSVNGYNLTATVCSTTWSTVAQETFKVTITGTPTGLNGPCGSDSLSVNLTCPNGGTLGGTYHGYCIVNGQPPNPNNGVSPQACQTMATDSAEQLQGVQYGEPGQPPLSQLPAIGAPGVYDPSDLSGSDPYSGCGLKEVGPRTHLTYQGYSTTTVFYEPTGLPATGSLTTDGQTSSASPSQPVQCDGANFCLNGSEILAQPGTSANDSQATINGQNIDVPSSIPSGACVSLTSGGLFCGQNAPQPLNTASPPVALTPTDTVTTTGAGGTTINNYYYTSTQVAGSSNYGAAGSSSGSTSTTTTCSGSPSTCTTVTTATTAANATTYPTPAFPAGTSPSASIASAANAIQSSPLVTAAAAAIAQTVPAGSCPDWVWNSTIFHTSFDFSNGPTGVCTLSASYASTLIAVFAAMWVVLGAMIILSA